MTLISHFLVVEAVDENVNASMADPVLEVDISMYTEKKNSIFDDYMMN